MKTILKPPKKIPLYPKWNCFHMEFPPLHGTGEPFEKSILVVERNRIKMRQKKKKKKGESSHRKQNFVRWGYTKGEC